jgi:hypothetical protein
MRSLLVLDTYSHKDFFAAVINDAGGQESMWTEEDLISCLDSINFVMAKEVGAECEISLSGYVTDGRIRSEYVVYELFSVTRDYVAREKVFVEFVFNSPDSVTQMLIEYETSSV